MSNTHGLEGAAEAVPQVEAEASHAQHVKRCGGQAMLFTAGSKKFITTVCKSLSSCPFTSWVGMSPKCIRHQKFCMCVTMNTKTMVPRTAMLRLLQPELAEPFSTA